MKKFLYCNVFQVEKIGKKVLALVLALMMVVSLMVSANAAVTFDDAADINPQYQEAVEVLQTLGIMQGVPTEVPATEEGAEPTTVNNFQPKTPLTRAQFAVILFKLATGDNGDEDTYAMYKTQNIYSDVPSTNYAVAHINYLNKIDAMHGIGGGKFDPDREVTGYEVVQGLLQALGYGKLGEFGDSWEDAKLVTAAYGTSKHITTGLGIDIRKVVTREELAALLFNALTRSEAHVVTAVATDGQHYVEDIASTSNWVTIGEKNWELHLYTRSSGSKYPSDKEISVKLDPFGRPTNPKWVARVDGKVVTIGTEDKALIEYYQKDPVTRQKMTNDFYTEFAFKDGYANTEYYVDGLLVDDPWTHVNATHAESPYDTIGGTGVTIEVYLMADKYVAISSDLVNEEWLRHFGETEIGSNNTWPRMRVVIVHHYAAQITKTMMIPANTATNKPAYLELPYDGVSPDYYCDICKLSGHVSDIAAHYNTRNTYTTRVSLPNTGKYKENDVIYFDVAIEVDNNGDLKRTVYNDVNLTNPAANADTDPDTTGCAITGPISYIDPDKAYIRMKDLPESNAKVAPGGAMYYNYFMQTTDYDSYNKANVKVGENQKVYLEPKNKEFVALIVSDIPAKQYSADAYYYVEAVEIRFGGNASVFTDKDIEIRAQLVDTVTGERTTDTVLDYTTSKTVDGSVWLTSIAGSALANPVLLYGPNSTGLFFTASRNSYAGYVYAPLTSELIKMAYTNNGGDVYTIPANNNYKVVIDGRGTPASGLIDEWYLLRDYMDLDRDGNTSEPMKDTKGNNIYFTVVTTRAFNGVEDVDTTKVVVQNIYGSDVHDVVDVANSKPGHVVYKSVGNIYVYSSDTALYLVNPAYSQLLNSPIFGTISDENYDRDMYNLMQYAALSGNTQSTYNRTIGNQFVRKVAPKPTEKGYTFVFNMRAYVSGKDCLAYDEDNSYRYNISSSIFDKNETSSFVTVRDTVYHTGSDTTVYVNENTMVYAFHKVLNTQTGVVEARYYGSYRYNQFEGFGINDPEPDVLVVTYNDNGIERAKYIAVISSDASDTVANYSFYGIYCGLNEVDEKSAVVRFVNTTTYKVEDYTITFNDPTTTVDDILRDEWARRHVGWVFGVRVDGGKITAVEEAREPETLVSANFNNIETIDIYGEPHTFNLYNPSYYYVGYSGGYYLAKVDADYVTPGRGLTVGVYQNTGNKTTVIIWAHDVWEGFKDGDPLYTDIDQLWDWNTHDNPNWNPST